MFYVQSRDIKPGSFVLYAIYLGTLHVLMNGETLRLMWYVRNTLR